MEQVFETVQSSQQQTYRTPSTTNQLLTVANLPHRCRCHLLLWMAMQAALPVEPGGHPGKACDNIRTQGQQQQQQQQQQDRSNSSSSSSSSGSFSKDMRWLKLQAQEWH
jgi:hypothetical protein